MITASTSINTAMIFAAGRGTRMRPLTDTCPKPLLEVGGKPLIVWQIERLAQAGCTAIIINHAWLGHLVETTLGDGMRWGVQIHYSAEDEGLETAGGIAHALPLFKKYSTASSFIAVSGDIFTDYDYRQLIPHAQRIAQASEAQMHLIMVPNPTYHPNGDFVLNEEDGGRLSLANGPRFTFGNIGVYDTRMFETIPSGTVSPLLPYYRAAINAQRATGELYTGYWANVGTPLELQALETRLRLMRNTF